MTIDLDRFLQLHQTIEIIYVVDGYEASYMVTDGQIHARTAKGDTILEALKNLQKSLNDELPKFGFPSTMSKCENCGGAKQWYSADKVTCARCNNERSPDVPSPNAATGSVGAQGGAGQVGDEPLVVRPTGREGEA